MRQFIVLLVLILSTLASVSADDCVHRLLARGGKRFIRVEAWVNAHADHRQIDVLVMPVAALTEDADPPSWDASSSRSLSGSTEKALHTFEFNGPPPGRYEVTVVISGGGKQSVQRTNVLTSF